MKYFFELGSNPALSVAEIAAVFDLDKNDFKLLQKDIFVLETKEKINAKEKISKMGGIIKIGQILNEFDEYGQDIILSAIKYELKPKEGKFKFGISHYGRGKLNIKPLAMEIKKYLKEKGASSRWVVSRDQVLSSVVVGQNKLDGKGMEIVLVQNENKIFLGKTLAVQPYKDLSKRDYGRPARDDKSGMLPPKLAQILINLSQAEKNDLLLDPFCGSGTVISEAMLMGYRNLLGSDLSKKAVKDSKENIEWTIKNYKLKIKNYNLQNIDVKKISNSISKNSIDAIVTEPYLGPQRGKIDLKITIKELEDLYSKSIKQFEKILKKEGRVVMLFPVFFQKNFLQVDLGNFKIKNLLPKDIMKDKKTVLTKRGTIVYGRPGQRVWREIVVLQK